MYACVYMCMYVYNYTPLSLAEFFQNMQDFMKTFIYLIN
jgi:hypothetical protein